MCLHVSWLQASRQGSGPGDKWSQDGCGHSGRSGTDRGSSRHPSDGDHPWSVLGEGLWLHQDGDEVRQHGDVPLDPCQVHRGLHPGEQRSFYLIPLLIPIVPHQDRNQAAMTVLNGHVVVCLFADPDSPLIGLRNRAVNYPSRSFTVPLIGPFPW